VGLRRRSVGEDGHLLLGPADEQHLLGAVTAGQVLVQHVVLALPLGEVDQWQVLLGGEAFDRFTECLAPRRDHRGRGDLKAQVPGQETHHLPDPLQLRHVQVQVEPVDRLDLEQHMTSQDISSRAG
jgi:hypothetical protein